MRAGSKRILGFMLESNLVEGRQDATDSRPLQFGQSITDGCISLEETERILSDFAASV